MLASTLGNVDGFQASRTEDGAGVVIAASYSHVGGVSRAYVLYRSNDPGATLPDSAIIDNFNFLKNTPGSNPKFSVELVELTSSQHAVVSDDGSYATGEFFQGGLRVLISADSEAHVLLIEALHELAAGLPK